MKNTILAFLLVISTANAKAQLTFNDLKQYTSCFDLPCAQAMADKQGFHFADSSRSYVFTHYILRADTLPAKDLNGRSMDFVFGITGATLTFKTDSVNEYTALLNDITTAGYAATTVVNGIVEGSKEYTYTKEGVTDIKITTYHKDYTLSLHRFIIDRYVIRIRPEY